MFQCAICGKSVPPRIKSTEVITQRRRKTYPYRQDANRTATWKDDKAERIASQNDSGGVGWEASEVMKACPQCARKAEGDIAQR